MTSVEIKALLPTDDATEPMCPVSLRAGLEIDNIISVFWRESFQFVFHHNLGQCEAVVLGYIIEVEVGQHLFTYGDIFL